ncbi:MAG: hypothetical protein RLZZ256_960, partial [Bacteroidota bacterium]
MINITRSARSLMMLLTLMLLTQEGWAQLLTENFSYSTAGNITSATANWTAHSGTTFYPQYTNSGLTFNGHAGSGVGGAITISSSGVADVNRTFTSQNSGTVYMSCLVNFSAGSGSVSDYFLHFNSGTFNARVQALTSTTNLRFGVSKAGTPAAVATNFSFNTTYLLVVKYTFNTGSLTDDNVDLWVLSSFASTEILAGTPLQSTSSGTDATSLSAVAIRQGTPPTGTIDAIRVGTTWASVTPPATYTLTYNGNSNT